MKYRKILLAYNGSHEGKRALLECGDLAGFLNAETHLLAVASMPPSLFLTEGFVPEELLEEEKKRTQTVLDEGIRTLRERGFNAAGQLAVGEPVEEICRFAPRLRALQHPDSALESLNAQRQAGRRPDAHRSGEVCFRLEPPGAGLRP